VKFSITILLILFGKFSFSQEIIELKKSRCAFDTDVDFVQNRLISKRVSIDTLTLIIELLQNCDVSPDAFISYIQDTIVLEIRNESNLFAACNCYFRYDLKITGVKDTNFILIHKFTDTEYVEKQFNWVSIERILNYKNKYYLPTLNEINNVAIINEYYLDSVKVGLWIKYFEDTEIIKEKQFYTISEEGEQRFKWAVLYNESANITRVCSIVNSDVVPAVKCLNWGEYLILMKQ